MAKLAIGDLVGYAWWQDSCPPCYVKDKVMEYLQGGGDPNAKVDEFSCLPHWVARFDTPGQLDALIAAGGDINCRSPWGYTPLFWMYEKFSLQNVMGEKFESRILTLLERGADINAAEQDGKTALHELVMSLRPRADEVSFLAGHGATVELKDKKGRQPIHNAAEMCQPLTAAKLVELGSKINAKDKDGLTPLHIVGDGIGVWHWPKDRLLSTVNGLLDLGADPNLKNKSGQTVLAHYLWRFGGMVSLFKALLEHGADPKLADKDGLTPHQHALSHGYSKTASLLVA